LSFFISVKVLQTAAKCPTSEHNVKERHTHTHTHTQAYTQSP